MNREVSEGCSFAIEPFLRGCVLLVYAAALLWSSPAVSDERPSSFTHATGSRSISVEGVPRWLRPSVERSVRSVWNEIFSATAPTDPEPRSGEADAERLAILGVVAERIFTGYVPAISASASGIVLTLEPEFPVSWGVEIQPPSLSSPVKEWFTESAGEILLTLGEMLALFPLEALSWADVALKEAIEELCAPVFPGWGISLLVRLRERAPSGERQSDTAIAMEESRVLQVSFYPKPPLVLAVVPSISSTTLPVAFRSDLKERILRTLAPVVGLPIEWAAQHRPRIEALAAEALLDTNTVSNARARVAVSFSPDQLSSVTAEVESPKYSIRAWIAAYAGSSGKYPEIGLHFGRKSLPFSGWDVELYGEWVLSAHDFSLQSRWGFRWSPWKNVLIGAEQAFPGNVLWYRLSVEGGERAPYFWWRLSEDGDSVLGLGYRLDERISLELHYDGRDQDKLTLRAISDL